MMKKRLELFEAPSSTTDGVRMVRKRQALRELRESSARVRRELRESTLKLGESSERAPREHCESTARARRELGEG